MGEPAAPASPSRFAGPYLSPLKGGEGLWARVSAARTPQTETFRLRPIALQRSEEARQPVRWAKCCCGHRVDAGGVMVILLALAKVRTNPHLCSF